MFLCKGAVVRDIGTQMGLTITGAVFGDSNALGLVYYNGTNTFLATSYDDGGTWTAVRSDQGANTDTHALLPGANVSHNMSSSWAAAHGDLFVLRCNGKIYNYSNTLSNTSAEITAINPFTGSYGDSNGVSEYDGMNSMWAWSTKGFIRRNTLNSASRLYNAPSLSNLNFLIYYRKLAS
jgi:hypothetical protein